MDIVISIKKETKLSAIAEVEAGKCDVMVYCQFVRDTEYFQKIRILSGVMLLTVRCRNYQITVV